MTDTPLKELVGKRVTAVYWSEGVVVFATDAGDVGYRVEGDCCSHSYFYDLIGWDKLLAGPVVKTEAINLTDEEERALEREAQAKHPEAYIESLAVYGYAIVTEHPQWGEVTCALSFRNESNGYYGGWMYYDADSDRNRPGLERLEGDKVGD